MKFIADFHLHSYFSRATSPQLNLEHLHKWAQLKGVTVIGTGDFLHPGWLQELQTKLAPAEAGLFILKPELASQTEAEVPASCKGEVRFLLTAEISNIYKRLGKVRKVHNIVFVPSFAAALKLQARLQAIGNLRADGRPILGLDSRDLLEITLEVDPLAYLIPAHIWTPWFSVLGSRSGFDSIDDCFADLTPEIFAVETGLSSDPRMNWRLRQLDRYVLVSNSDAHSPQKIAREANVFDTELSYSAIRRSLKEKDDPGLLATVEFFPEEGKYHFDGHRACKVRLHPRETVANAGKCPACGKDVTVGVMARVEELADRPDGEKSPRWRPYYNLIPLPEVIAEASGQGLSSRSVVATFAALLKTLGNELFLLQEAPLSEIERVAGTMVAEGIRRMRTGKVTIAAGFDGEYGRISLFTEAERKSLARQTSFLPPAAEVTKKPGPAQTEKTSRTSPLLRVRDKSAALPKQGDRTSAPALGNGQARLNPAQAAAVQHGATHLLIVAGPGTGKTHTLAHRIARITQRLQPDEKMLCMTFTHKAAEEMQSRIRELLTSRVDNLFAGTFHAFGLHVLKRFTTPASLPPDFTIATENEKEHLARILWPQLSQAGRLRRLEQISLLKSAAADDSESAGDAAFRREFDAAMRQQHKLDFDDLIVETIRLLQSGPAIRAELHDCYRWIFVDEYQDINAAQHALLKLLVGEKNLLTAIGDPEQSIYGFRGSRPDFFASFAADFPGAAVMHLNENYRSAPALLTAASQVIAAGAARFVPPLSPVLLTPGRLVIHTAATALSEAEYVVHQIEKMVGGTSLFSRDSGRVSEQSADEGRHSFGDVAVLYRLSALRPPLQEALDRAGMPSQISGETPLIDKPGIRPLVVALRLAGAMRVHAEEVAAMLGSVLEVCGHGAPKELGTILRAGEALSLHALRQCVLGTTLNQKQRQVVQDFCRVLEQAARKVVEADPAAALQLLVTATPYFFRSGDGARADQSLERLHTLARQHTRLQDFLEALSLHREFDDFAYHAERISLLTLHAAKGLEFHAVFIIGCEEGILPLSLPGRAADPDEERRLFYVGMTRAKEHLFLTRAGRRSVFGKVWENSPSPFLGEIEEHLKEYEFAAAPLHKLSAKKNKDQLSLF